MKNSKSVSHFLMFLFLQTAILTGLTNCNKEEEEPAAEQPELTEARGSPVGANLPQLARQVFWSRDGKEIIVRCSPGVYAINIETDSVRTINEDLKSVYARYSKDGEYLFYISKGDDTNLYNIGKLDMRDGSTRILVKNSVAGPLIISADEEMIAYLIKDIPEPSIFIYHASTDNIQPFVPGIPRAFNPEGTKMIVRNDRDQKIYLINMDDRSTLDLKLDMIYKYRYFWNEDRIFVMADGRITDVFNKTSKTTNLSGVLGRSWTRSMTFNYYCIDEICNTYYVTYYLINDNPYLEQPFATAIAFNFGFPTFAPDEQHAAYIIDFKVYITKLPF